MFFKKVYKQSFLLIVLLLLAVHASFAQSKENKGDLSALFFGDYYWFAANHNEDFEGNNGFWIRRVYLTYDYQISESFSGRVRLEMEGAGDFKTDAGLAIGVKDAWLKYEYGQHEITAGIASTPTWDLVETVWGYRSIAKSPLDLQDMGSSRGLGVSLKGKLGDSKRFGYFFMFANGNGSATELNQGKKFMLSLSYELTNELIVQFYGDYEDTGINKYAYTFQSFLGYQSEKFNIGALYAYQWLDATATTLTILSLFTNFDITEDLRGYLRADHMFKPNPVGEEIAYIPFSDKAESTFLVGGIDIQLHPKVSLMPNVEMVLYGENEAGLSPDNDLIARLTLFFKL